MGDKPVTVFVNASFEQGAALFEWIKRYAKHSDDRFVYWDEFAFSADRLTECDAVLVFNNPAHKITTTCFPEAVIAFMMEPGNYRENPWMFKGLEQYAKVYSPVRHSENSVLSPGFLGWHLHSNWSQLSGLVIPEKNAAMSCIASTLRQFKGHRLRYAFIQSLKKEIPSIEYFGRGSRYITDKMDGLLPYRYSIAIENTAIPYYFTEKITDCFLSYTVPVYYGCRNIDKFFPENSFVRIDIEKPEKAIFKIRDLIENNDWAERLSAIQEAREFVLNKYQPLAAAAAILRQTHTSHKRQIQLKPVPDRLLRKIKNLLK